MMMCGTVPERPWQHFVVIVNMGVKTAVGHELVDKQELATAMAPSDKLNEVAVSQPAYDPYLRNVLLPPLLGGLGHPFYRNTKVQVLEIAVVHRSKASFSKFLLVREETCGNGQLAVAEPPRPGPFLKIVFRGLLVVVRI
jgi:hypothetical protein